MEDCYQNSDGLLATLRVDRIINGDGDRWIFGAELRLKGTTVGSVRPGVPYSTPVFESERDARQVAVAWIEALGFREVGV